MTENERNDYQEAQKWLEGYDWDNDPMANSNLATICKVLQEIQQYRAIGTVEECREAREKQRAKKPTKKTKWYKNRNHDLYTNSYFCPFCGELFLLEDSTGFYGGIMSKHCEDCGQAIDWSDAV